MMVQSQTDLLHLDGNDIKLGLCGVGVTLEIECSCCVQDISGGVPDCQCMIIVSNLDGGYVEI